MDPTTPTRRVLLIKERLRSISANDLQRLTEELARILYPQRFVGQMFYQGRNVEGQTTKGWPDAYCEAPGGKVHGIEATRERASWKTHLDADLKKAATSNGKHKKLASYFFVGGYPDHEPSDAELNDYRGRFKALGLEAGAVNLLIGHGLAEHLARPECARVVHQLLGIRPEPRLFELLEPGALHDRQLADFQPTELDFAQGLVWESPLVDRVEVELRKSEAVLVRGHGASGKTTFAQSIAQRWAPRPVYYLDLVDTLGIGEPPPGALASDIVEFGKAGVLFIIDNVHVDERIALTFYSAWRRYALGSDGLLLLGREIHSSSGSALGPLTPHVLRAGADAALGVINRLLVRGGHPVRTFRDAVVQRWITTFGGDPAKPDASVDLVAFGAAAEIRLENLARGDAELRAEDAIVAVRERYLARVGQEERENLIRLSALAELEVSLPAAAMVRASAAFAVSNTVLGIVLRERVGRGGRTVYRLGHAALGKLILAAAGAADQIESLQAEIAQADPATGLHLLGRIAPGPAHKRLEAVLAEILGTDVWIERCATLPSLINVIRTATNRRLLSDAAMAALPVSDHFASLYLAERDLVVQTQLHALLAQRAKPALDQIGALSGQHIKMLAERLCSTTIVEAVSYIDSHPIGMEILAAIDVQQWNACQRETILPPPAAAVGAIRRLESWKRKDLIPAAIDRFVRNPDPAAWESKLGAENDLRHVSQLLRATSSLDRQVRLAFLQAVATPEWLDHQYRELRAGAIGSSLLSLHQHGDDGFLCVLDRQSLGDRLADALGTLAALSSDQAVRTFALLGTAALVRPTDSFPNAAWPAPDAINALLAHGAMRPVDSDDLGTFEMQFWMGLRRMMDMRQAIPVKLECIQGFNRRLRLATAPTPRAEQVRAALLSWTSACVAAGGLLQPQNPNSAQTAAT
jgi:hypothetical protein